MSTFEICLWPNCLLCFRGKQWLINNKGCFVYAIQTIEMGVSDDEVCENGLGFPLRPVNSEDREF